jgi:hypothetical protein
MGIKNIFVKTIFLSALGMFCILAVGGSFFHDHADLDYHDDCHICQWAVNSVFTFSISFVFFSVLFFCRKVIQYAAVAVSVLCKTILRLRSPPYSLSYS